MLSFGQFKINHYNQKNNFKAAALNAEAQHLLVKLSTLSDGGYSTRTVRNYTSEVRFLFSYFNDLDSLSIDSDEIILYINYLKASLNLGRDNHDWRQKIMTLYPEGVIRRFEKPKNLFFHRGFVKIRS